MTNVQLAMSNLLDHFPPLRTHSPQLKLDTKAAPTSKMKWSYLKMVANVIYIIQMIELQCYNVIPDNN